MGEHMAEYVRLTEDEREWLALTIMDAAGEPCTDDAARLIEARVETLIARRLEPVWAILRFWEAWDGSPGPDGRIHPDSSSPRDRERLRAALTFPPGKSTDG